MKVVAVIGSPHPNGPSATLTREFLRGAKDAGHETVEYVVNEMQIRGCQGCRACKNASIDCVVQDDLAPYWTDIHEAGAIVVSAPNYAGTICGPMITYMNRHYCLLDKDWNTRVTPGIKAVGIFSQGVADREQYMPQYSWYMADFQNRKMELLDIIVHTGKDSVEKGSELMERAYQLGYNL